MALIWKAKKDPDRTGKTGLGRACGLTRDLASLPSNAAIRHESMLINEINLVLAEKRTSLSVMRTGLAVLALPLSVFSVLVVISRYYDPLAVMYLLGPLLGLCAALTILGIYLIIKSLRRISHLNLVVLDLKRQNENLRELCVAMDDVVGPDDDF
jgi:hypothetical protein